MNINEIDAILNDPDCRLDRAERNILETTKLLMKSLGVEDSSHVFQAASVAVARTNRS